MTFISNLLTQLLVQDIETFLKKYYQQDEALVLACSTWADSMFLLYHILQSSYKQHIVACYFNHKTRPECQQEEAFLQELGKKHHFPVEVWQCDFEKDRWNAPSKSFEEYAREKRYQFLREVCHRYHTDKIITGHHFDDRLETYFFHMLRGTKLTWLINMQEFSGGILRPLLQIEKKDIYAYLKEHNLMYFEDSSNTSSEHTRNSLRHDILPRLESIHPEYKKNIWNLLAYFEEIKWHLDWEVMQFLWEKKHFEVTSFFKLSDFMQKEVIKHLYFVSHNASTIWLSEANIREVLRFIRGKNNKTKKEIRNMKLFKDGDTIYFIR